MAKSKTIKINYAQTKTDPEIIQQRIKKAFDILFNETDNQNTTDKI